MLEVCESEGRGRWGWAAGAAPPHPGAQVPAGRVLRGANPGEGPAAAGGRYGAQGPCPCPPPAPQLPEFSSTGLRLLPPLTRASLGQGGLCRGRGCTHPENLPADVGDAVLLQGVPFRVLHQVCHGTSTTELHHQLRPQGRAGSWGEAAVRQGLLPRQPPGGGPEALGPQLG